MIEHQSLARQADVALEVTMRNLKPVDVGGPRNAGQRALLALELIEKHAYDRSRFLRGARVVDDDEGQALAEATLAAEPAQPVRYLHPGRTEFQLLDRPISFDDRQQELFRLPLPMVLVGCAGSGKTALTLTKLRQLPGNVLYVTQSAYLAESAATPLGRFLVDTHPSYSERARLAFDYRRRLSTGRRRPARRRSGKRDRRRGHA